MVANGMRAVVQRIWDDSTHPTSPMTGSSVSCATAASVVAAAWESDRSSSATGAMADALAGGVPLGRSAQRCPSTSCPVRRLDVHGAIAAACARTGCPVPPRWVGSGHTIPKDLLDSIPDQRSAGATHTYDCAPHGVPALIEAAPGHLARDVCPKPNSASVDENSLASGQPGGDACPSCSLMIDARGNMKLALALRAEPELTARILSVTDSVGTVNIELASIVSPEPSSGDEMVISGMSLGRAPGTGARAKLVLQTPRGDYTSSELAIE